MYLGPGGLVGYHPAGTYQLFTVIEGDGWVRADGSERVPIGAGQAAFWQPGEGHEAGTDAGMTAIVVETDALGGDPAAIGPAPPTGD
jgi:quercetin dioxygenase-like cupin family protein